MFGAGGQSLREPVLRQECQGSFLDETLRAAGGRQLRFSRQKRPDINPDWRDIGSLHSEAWSDGYNRRGRPLRRLYRIPGLSYGGPLPGPDGPEDDQQDHDEQPDHVGYGHVVVVVFHRMVFAVGYEGWRVRPGLRPRAWGRMVGSTRRSVEHFAGLYGNRRPRCGCAWCLPQGPRAVSGGPWAFLY